MPSNQFNSWRTGIQIDNIYPVGSIYMSVNATDPGTLFGGSWEAIENTFLVAQGSSFTAGSTGGTTTHTHTQVATTSGGPSNNTSGSTAITIAQMPSHNHGSAGGHGHGLNKQVPYGVPYNNTSGSLSGNSGSGPYYGETYNPPWTVASNGAHTHTSQGSGSGHTHTLSSHTHSTSATTTGSGNNLPPYMAVYMWKRTA